MSSSSVWKTLLPVSLRSPSFINILLEGSRIPTELYKQEEKLKTEMEYEDANTASIFVMSFSLLTFPH